MDQTDSRLREATHGLIDRSPHLSAHRVLTARQAIAMGVLVATLVLLGLAHPLLVLRGLVTLITLAYLAALAYRVALIINGTKGSHMVHVSDEEALAFPADDLPLYTVLVPAFREPLIGELVAGLAAMDYPHDKLDIRLLLEADDDETVAAAEASNPPSYVTILLVPPSQPRTKPKACNYGLADADAELVTIYDAEDVPDRLQLRRAVVALHRLGPDYACVQAQLGYFNSRQNLLTRWFTVEYGAWFTYLLPGLIALGAPVPLGGTSNHFRADVLKKIGAWDPHNVTEDADLGMRLARLGHRVGVIDSVTLEEANSDSINWIKQRSRWYKGYLQTCLVHLRHPVTTWRQLGSRGITGLILFIGGTPVLAAINAVFWMLTAMWFVGRPAWIPTLFTPFTYYLGLICFVGGNFLVVYMNVFATRQLNRPDLLLAALTTPAYWVLMSLAAIKAVVQLVFQPSYWEKTTHGLHKTKTVNA